MCGARIPRTSRIIPCVLLLLLVGGAVVTIAVAWCCAWWVHLVWDASGPVEDDAQIVAWVDARSWENDLDGPFRPVWFVAERGFGRRRVHLSAEVISGRIMMPADLTLDLAGWPLSALQGDSAPLWTGGGYTYEENGLVHLPIGGGVTPVRPIWPGLAFNTLFYAGILWLLFAAPLALRRRRRIRRGLCPACAYPVVAGEVCTECGKPVSQTR
jgi:hypothetical protein